MFPCQATPSRFENSQNVKMRVIRVLRRYLQHATSTFSEFRKHGNDGPTLFRTALLVPLPETRSSASSILGGHELPYGIKYDLELSVIALIGIVKKNAIMMIDFALEAERAERKSSVDAICRACLLRFRPIMMTTMAALLGALPLGFGLGVGSELRRPLGIAIVGGLIFSQLLTLYTTPVVYLYLDRRRLCFRRRRTGLTRPNYGEG
jgi:hypothetical protein